jgi:hypothetical protein
MAYGINMVPDALRSAAFGAILATYSAVGSAFAHPVRILIMQNLTDTGVIVSFDSSIAAGQFVVPANGFILLDISSDKVNDSGAFIEKGTQVYVKRLAGAGASGAFYVSALYCLGD